MSIASLTSLAAARQDAPPKKSDVGKAGKDDGDATASWTDVLVSQVPTELVAPYTAISASIVATVGAKDGAAWRWAAFAVLLVGTIGFVWGGARRKAEKGITPVLETVGAAVAATGWAFVLPGSPLSPYLHSKAAETLTPMLVAFSAIVLTGWIATGLTAQRQPSKASALAKRVVSAVKKPTVQKPASGH